ELPGLKADHVPAPIGERKEEPAREVVGPPAADESGRLELLARESLLERLRRHARPERCESESEFAADVFGEPALDEVRPRRLSLRRIPEVALVELRGVREQVAQPLLAPPPLLVLGRALLVLELDAVAIGQRLDGLGKVESFRLADEGDEVAALAAAEAVEELVGGVHGEARRPLLVERAAAGPARPDAAERRSCRDDLDHVGGRDHLLDRGLLDQCHARAKRSVIPAT